jgi:hypothetical protein
MDTQNRRNLKSFFLKNSIPTESNFSDLIDSFINQADDGLVIGDASKPVNFSLISKAVALSGTLSVEANSDIVQGRNSNFQNELHVNEQVTINQGATYTVLSKGVGESFIIDRKIAEAITNGTATVKRDILSVLDAAGNTIFYISNNGQIGINKKPQTALDVNGNVTAGSFTGDGSKLTSLSASNLKGFIPKEIIPVPDPVNVSAINGLLTITEAYDQKLTGTVSGKSGEALLTGTGTDFTTLIPGQKISIATQIVEVLAIANDKLTLKKPLTDAVTDKPIYVAGRFLSLKDVNGVELFTIGAKGSIFTSGSVQAGSFTGDGSKLTSLSSFNLKGVIPIEIIPVPEPVNVSAINGQLTITETYDKKLAGTVSGKSGEAILTGTGVDFKGILAGQKIVIATKTYGVLSSEPAKLTLKSNLTEDIKDQAVYIAGNFLSLKDVNVAELLTIDAQANIETSGAIRAGSFTGDGSKLTSLSTSELKGVIAPGNLPPEVFTSDINGRLTITETYDQKLDGAVSGNKGEDILTVKDVDLKLLSAGQKIRIATQILEIRSIADDKLTLQLALTDTITDQPIYMAGSFLSLKDVNATELLNIDAKANIATSGSISAGSFAGDGSKLTSLSTTELKGVIAAGNLPPEVFTSDVTGLFTITEAYDQKLDGTVSGAKGDDTLTVKDVDLKLLSAGQKIRIATQILEIKSITNDKLTLQPALTDTITDQPVYVAGNFLLLKDVNDAGVLTIGSAGSINSSGSVKAKDFTGDGSGLTNLPASSIEGVIPDKNLPPVRPVKISEISGLLTITEAYDQKLDGTVSGAKDDVILTGTGTSFKTLTAGQKIRVSTQIFEVISISEDTLTLKDPLTDAITDQLVYIAGGFLSLKDVNNADVLAIGQKGNIVSSGSVQATDFTGDGSKLTNISVSELRGIIRSENLPPVESSSNLNGLLTINGAYDRKLAGTVSGEKDSNTLKGNGTSFKALLSDGQKIKIAKTIFDILTITSETELILLNPLQEKFDDEAAFMAGDFLSLIDTDRKNITTISSKGDVYTHGVVRANKFEGEGSALHALQAAQLQGLISPVQTPRYINVICDKPVLNGEETATLSWSTNVIDELKLQYPLNGQLRSLSTNDNSVSTIGTTIVLQQTSFPLSLYQTTTVTLTGVKSGIPVSQQQVTVTVIQNTNQYTAQLKYEGFNLTYIINLCGARFGLATLNEQNLLTLAGAIKNNSFNRDEAIAAIRAYYKNGGQSWDPSVHDLILYQVFDGDLQFQINAEMLQHSPGTALPDLLVTVSAKFGLSGMTDQNVKYLATGVNNTEQYPLGDIFRFIPQFFRNAGGVWLPQQHGIILQSVCSK